LYIDEYKRWQSVTIEDKDLVSELQEIQNNDKEMKERFGAELSFGTAGLRGILGVGTNRMNIYTVAKATTGLAMYVLTQHNPHSVAIAYDSRHKSELFAQTAVEVLVANGIKVYLYKTLAPTPMLSFAVRYLNCTAGIMVTASHNPAEYNGYKVYGADGCQMTSDAADAVQKNIQQVDIFEDVKRIPFKKALDEGMVEYIDEELENVYYEEVKKQSVNIEVHGQAGLKVVYTPLNGAGKVPVCNILSKVGVQNITLVTEQEQPDGDFPTCKYPNPETKEAMALGLEYCKKTNADLLLATDPDADRVGIAVKAANGYELLTGNEVGVLLTEYLAKVKTQKGTLPENSVLIKSFVSTGLADVIAKDYGIDTINVLTGFKYIGEQILALESKGQEERFFFGFEESYGYLSGTYVRDKDAVVACMLICEMAAYYKLQGITIKEELNALYEKYGYYLHKVDSYAFEGLSGMEKMKEIMQGLRNTDFDNIAELDVISTEDYLESIKAKKATGKTEKINLPKADVLVYNLAGNAQVIVRPSGTEPKIKVYFTTRANTHIQAEEQYTKLAKDIEKILA